MPKRLKRLALLALVAAIAAVLATHFLPRPARPQIMVPQVSLTQNADQPLRAMLVEPQSGLAALALVINGRASAGDKMGTLSQEWPGFYVEARFVGPAARVRFQDDSNRWRVTLDGGRAGAIEVARPGMQDLRIEGLAGGPHLIRVERISESFTPASFGGIFVADAAAALPAPDPRPLTIEFIGDSDTVGFANGSDRRDCTESEIYATTDTSRSFGPQVAQALGADYRIVARSGIGLMRNYGGTAPQSTMRSRYAQALPSDPTATRLPQRGADIVVTALGSNDFGSEFAATEPWQDNQALSPDFEAALIAFLNDRARENPDALQVLLAFGEYGPELTGPYEAAARALAAKGVRTALVTLPKLQRTACQWHPSAQDHAMIADRLIAAIREHQG